MADNSYTPLIFSPKPIVDQVSGSPRPTANSQHATNHSDPPFQHSLFQHRGTDRETSGSDSPRSKVTQRFKDLDLSNGQDGYSGGGVSDSNNNNNQVPAPDLNPGLGPPSSPSPAVPDGTADAHGSSDVMDLDSAIDDPHSNNTAKPSFSQSALGAQAPSSSQQPTPGHLNQTSTTVNGDSKPTEPTDNTTHVISHKSGLPLSHRAESKNKGRRTTNGTPPPSWKRKKIPATSDEEQSIVDPVRAELTWHQDEITVYDPDDQDDDGTGVNGIGFKQTHAHAQRLKQRRRQQLAEYRKREENDARARRSVRRRGQKNDGHPLQRKHSIIRVHFSEAEPSTFLTA